MRHLALKGLSDVFATIKKLNLPFLYPPWNVVPRLELPVKNNELNFEWGGGGGGLFCFLQLPYLRTTAQQFVADCSFIFLVVACF